MSVITLANPVRPTTALYQSASGKPIDTSMGNIRRVVPVEEVAESEWYADMAKLAVIFNHEIIETEPREEGGNPVWRWRANMFMDWISDHAGIYSPSKLEEFAEGKHGYGMHSKEGRASLNLNILVRDLHNGMFTMEEWMKFYMQIGYSLSGYGEVFGQHEAAEYDLPGAKKPKSQKRYTETVIDYMIRIHDGKVLKL